jgi:hypothetical protein
MQNDDHVDEVRQAIHLLASDSREDQVNGQELVRAMGPRAVQMLIAAFKIEPRRIRTMNHQWNGLGFVVTLFLGLMLIPPLFRRLPAVWSIVAGHGTAIGVAGLVLLVIWATRAVRRRQGRLAMLGADSVSWPTAKVNRKLLQQALAEVNDIHAIGPLVDILPAPAVLPVEPPLIPLLGRLGDQAPEILDTVQRLRLYRTLVSSDPSDKFDSEADITVLDFQIAVLKLVETSRDKLAVGFVRQASERKLKTDPDRRLAEAAKACLASFSRGAKAAA